MLSRVSIPEFYYKVLLDLAGKSHKGIGFILPNRAGSSPLQSYAVSIDSVEKVTGIDFFYALADKQENELEHAFCLPCWEWDAANIRQGASEQKTTSKPEQSPHKVNSDKAAVQCSGKTKSGTRCKRSTSSASGKCYQHE
jgi:endonuclease G